MSMDSAAKITAITSGNITIDPFRLESLDELTVIHKLNDHVRVRLQGVLYNGAGAEEDKYAINADTDTRIEIKVQDNPQVEKLFSGIIANVAVKLAGGKYFLEAEALSHSYQLDIKLQKRSFQDRNMTYQDLLNTVKKDYSGMTLSDNASQGKKLERFILQYNESDWDFLKRIASHFNAGLLADAVAAQPKLALGLPRGSGKALAWEELENTFYSVSKKLFDYRYAKENALRELTEKDVIYYEIESYKYLEVGSQVTLNGIQFVIVQSTAQLTGGSLHFQYLLVHPDGLTQNKIWNTQIVGAAIEGKVLKVEQDHVKLHLEIDEKQNVDQAYLFPYSTFYTTEGNTGWYCMPEEGDSVKLYFPSCREAEAIVINSIRKNEKGGAKITDPSVKYFRTKFGKELMFSEEEIVITGKDGTVLIRLNEADGIEVFSKQEVKISAAKDVQIHSGKKVTITAGQEIDLACKSSSLKLDGQTHIKGTIVKTNS
jgi:hypothetical protein